MSDLNQCNFIGRLGRDPEIKYTGDGLAITSFSLAVGSKVKGVEVTEWVNIVAFGKLGEICGEYLHKGSQAYISGRMKTEKYTDKNGIEKYSTKIIAENLQMLGGKSDKPNSSQVEPKSSKNKDDDFPDDIPF
jgi:single-strand DNA-binding protein